MHVAIFVNDKAHAPPVFAEIEQLGSQWGALGNEVALPGKINQRFRGELIIQDDVGKRERKVRLANCSPSLAGPRNLALQLCAARDDGYAIDDNGVVQLRAKPVTGAVPAGVDRVGHADDQPCP